MTNKTITLPRNLVEEVVQTCAFTLTEIAYQELRAALADPVPPAGGEPEVVGYRCRQSETEKWHMSSTPAYWEHQPVILLEEHRAHVTRLQAEVERLKANSTQLATLDDQTIKKLGDKLRASQSELTKARELLSTHCPNISIGVREFLSNQSAPADKGQGEPVAWQFYQDGKWWNGDDRIKDHRKNTIDAGYEVRDLYAEQPAPVAVVMPEHRDSDLRSPVYGYARGWNACLDELARLNSEPKP